jgi:hypothetical protein
VQSEQRVHEIRQQAEERMSPPLTPPSRPSADLEKAQREATANLIEKYELMMKGWGGGGDLTAKAGVG